MASWCISCADIERDLKEIAKDKNVQVITVDVESQTDTKEDLAAFKKTYGGNWPHALDTNLSFVKSLKCSFPTSFSHIPTIQPIHFSKSRLYLENSL